MLCFSSAINQSWQKLLYGQATSEILSIFRQSFMKILVIHNRYRERTGEDSVFDREVKLLLSYGHTVHTWIVDNQAIQVNNAYRKLSLAVKTVWAGNSFREIFSNIIELKPDIVHVHNTLPLLSPTVFHACYKAHVPVVHTLHNYRLICPANTLFRDGNICEDCVDGSLLNSVIHSCYRDSRSQTATVAAMLQFHRACGTWKNKVSGYIALSEFQRAKLDHIGVPTDNIYIKPNFIEGKLKSKSSHKFGSYYLFVGRLIDEKGIQLLIEGYTSTSTKYPLIIMGPGYLEKIVVKAAASNPLIRYLGTQPKSEVLNWMENAIALLFPSVWYECSPMTILEAFSCSLPVVSSNIGAITDMVKHQKTGYVFSPASSQALTRAIQWIEQNSEIWLAMKRDLFQHINPVYFQAANYERLIEIYRSVIDKHNSQGSRDSTLRRTRAGRPN